MTEDELEAQPPTRPLTSPRSGPSRPPRMAKPIPGALKEVTPEPPRQSDPAPTLDLTPDEPYDDVPALDLEPEVLTDASPLPGPDEQSPLVEAEPIVATPLAEDVDTPAPETATAPEAAAPKQEPAEADSSPAEPGMPGTVRETLHVVDESWRAFHARAARFPSERMDERLSDDGWTRKQMLAHVAAWHDLTADRLLKFYNTGEPPEFKQDVDQFNAMVARRAVGKTAGEILNDTEATFNRLRRQLQRLSDVQLRQFDHWAAWVIKGNTYGHYEEHWQDVYVPEPPPGTAARR